MEAIRGLKRIRWLLLRLLFGARQSWDSQYEEGAWDHATVSPNTLKLVKSLSGGGSILEFGCGDGKFASALPRSSYSSYLGYDISLAAIAKARARADANGLIDCRFETMPIEKWNGDRNVSLIVVEECLYYLTEENARRFLKLCLKSIKADGHILIIMHSHIKHRNKVELVREFAPELDEMTSGDRIYQTVSLK
jgi:cyclopropane fatty-acyl-phospholipid synthase-like methyltransferase